MPPLLALCHLLTKPKGAEPCEGVLSPWGQAESPGFGISLPGRGPHAGLVRLTWAGLWPWVALWQGLWLGEQTGPLLSSVAPSLLSRWSPGGWGGGLTGSISRLPSWGCVSQHPPVPRGWLHRVVKKIRTWPGSGQCCVSIGHVQPWLALRWQGDKANTSSPSACVLIPQVPCQNQLPMVIWRR